MAERDFPEPNIEEIQKSNILIVAPVRYPLIAAIDIRPSTYSNPTIATLDLNEAIAPCPQLPDVRVEIDPTHVKSLPQTYHTIPKKEHPIITQLVSQNILNCLNDIRTGMSDEAKKNYRTSMLFIGNFSTFGTSDVWHAINKHLSKTQPPALVLDVNEFISRQAMWEQGDKAYITGANGSRVIWQRE